MHKNYETPKYVVSNTLARDIDGKALVTASGNDLEELLSAYHGKAYQIMKVKSLSDREEW
jgi:hypothetical protein